MDTLLPSRLFFYELLQRICAEPPTIEFLTALGQDSTFASLAEISQGAQCMVEAVQGFTAGDSQAQLEALRQDYDILFVGPGPLPAPLWESVFLDREHLLFGAETLQVRQFYARFGLAYARRGSQPEDHIAIELDFMATLIRKTMACLEQGDRQGAAELLQGQADFLQEHLLRWALPASEIFSQQAATKFYQGAGRLLVEYLPLDLDLIQSSEEEECSEA